MSVPAPITAVFHRLTVLTGLPWLMRETAHRDQAIVLCYHDPSPEVMAAHLGFFARRFSFVTLADVTAWLEGRLDELPPKPLVVTFDDGMASNLELAKVLTEHGVVPTFFVCTQIAGTRRGYWWESVSDDRAEELKRCDDAERLDCLAEVGFREEAETSGPPAAMDWDEVRALREWADVQSHTRLHPILPRCTDERARAEIVGSRQELTAALEREVYALAYPNGSYSSREVGLAREAGYRCALTVEPEFVDRGSDLLELGRFVMSDTASVPEVAVTVSGIHGVVRRFLQRLHVVAPDA